MARFFCSAFKAVVIKSWASRELKEAKSSQLATKKFLAEEEESLVVKMEFQASNAVAKVRKMETVITQTITISTIRPAFLPLSLPATYHPKKESKWHRPVSHRLKSHQPLILRSSFSLLFDSDLTFLVFADLNAPPCVALYASLFSFAIAIAIANAEVIAIVYAIAIVAFAFAFAAIPVAVAVAVTFSFYQIQFACVVYLVLLPPLDAKDHTQAHHL